MRYLGESEVLSGIKGSQRLYMVLWTIALVIDLLSLTLKVIMIS